MSTFGYQLNMSYFESQAEGIMDQSSRYSVVGVKMGRVVAFIYKMIWNFFCCVEMTSLYLKFLLLYYLPSYMITISSWFFYLLPSTSYPARTALLMTAFLLLIQIYNSVVTDTPNSNGKSKPSIFWSFSTRYISTFTIHSAVFSRGDLLGAVSAGLCHHCVWYSDDLRYHPHQGSVGHSGIE